ncbi:MAG: response regulator [Elusimicrobia bacterium]|nr:response regulator [Elusimicrobiota bacterium]
MAKTVQICDDDEGICGVLVRLLSPHYKVTVATCGSEALALIAERCPDLVLLDMVMPGMSGLETLEAYHKTNPLLPTVVLTGDQEPEDARRALDLGAHVYITKPFDSAVLLDEIRAIFASETLERDGSERPPWRVKPGPSA